MTGRAARIARPARWEADVVIHSAPLVLPVSAPPVHDGALVVRRGRIVALGPRAGILASWPEREETRWDGVIVAGLVNAHTHLQYTHMAEVGQRTHASFEEWSTAFDEVYFGTPIDWAASALDGARQALRSGTTSAADVVTDLPAAGALRAAGLGGLPYLETLGDNDASWAGSGRERFAAMLDAAEVPMGISPHAPYTLDTGTLRDVTALARSRGARLHIHLAEGEHEREYTVSGTGPLALMVRELGFDFAVLREGGTGLGPTAFLDELGVLGPRCHVAHGVHLDADDRALLRARGTVVALCPRSNRTVGTRGPDVAALLTEGNPIAVGTDSLSSSPSLDLLEDVAALRDLAVRQGYRAADLDRRLVEAATLGGARALGVAGGLAPGGPADFAVFDVSPGARPYRTLIEEGPGRCVATVVAGEMMWDQRTAAAVRC
ncbi:amidohydrolase family protein [Streptosporangium sp. CA-135522]|uniref:amidohydrolase family protein n=1 Tax=Streptosporangium sp. CA-135522 TaxID=3240072 RepID=UPI003D948FD2